VLHALARLGRGRTQQSLSMTAAVCAMAGSLVLRWSIFEAGKTSSEDQGSSFDLSSG
jgi:hypothetical protein